MVGKAGLKAGVIGMVILVVMTLLNQFVLLKIAQAFSWISCGINLLVYVGMGVLAGLFLVPPRTPNQGAGAGAIAGLVSGVISSAVGVALLFAQVASGQPIPGVDPQQMQLLAESGVDPAILVVLGSIGAVCSLAIGIGLAAIGGAIFAAVKSD
ncbi:MAG: hypothetical protein GY832_39475 [Chloroflexi bacterium]|nr:hypothetical protein [Chloroflexota bacterium]